MIEDEAELARRTIASLARAGITTEWLASAEDAAGFAGDGFNALIVDLGLPGISGLELVRSLRRRGIATPILILTARGSWQEKVDGLNAGADDFLVKPVRAEELIARLHALARRTAGHLVSRLEEGALALDTGTREAWLAGAPVALSRNEFRLLRAFLLEPNRTLSRDAILDRLYALDAERDPNTIEVLVGRLRRKIGRDRIAALDLQLRGQQHRPPGHAHHAHRGDHRADGARQGDRHRQQQDAAFAEAVERPAGAAELVELQADSIVSAVRRTLLRKPLRPVSPAGTACEGKA